MKREHYSVKEYGFCGDFFPGTVYKNKAILYVQGMGVDEELAIAQSRPFREQGYHVMVLGFYMWEGLPKKMYDIPLEYVERAIAMLKKKGITEFCIHGASSSSRYVMEAALRMPEITCVIAVVPYDYITEGLKHNMIPTGHSIYTWRKEPLPYMAMDCLKEGVFRALRRFFRSGETLAHLTRWSYDVQEHYDESARVKIEHLKANILLMAPDYDDLWPSDQAVRRMEKVLRDNRYAYPYEIHVYQGGSHTIGMTLDEKTEKVMAKIMSREKANPNLARARRQQSIQDMLRFTREWMERRDPV